MGVAPMEEDEDIALGGSLGLQKFRVEGRALPPPNMSRAS